MFVCLPRCCDTPPPLPEVYSSPSACFPCNTPWDGLGGNAKGCTVQLQISWSVERLCVRHGLRDWMDSDARSAKITPVLSAVTKSIICRAIMAGP